MSEGSAEKQKWGFESTDSTPIVNTSGLKPVGVAVLVKPYEVKKVTKGGIVLPETTRDRDMLAEQRAYVIEVGPCAWADEDQPRAKSGDRVLFAKWAGYIAIGTLDGQQYRVVNDRDIFMQIVEEKD